MMKYKLKVSTNFSGFFPKPEKIALETLLFKNYFILFFSIQPQQNKVKTLFLSTYNPPLLLPPPPCCKAACSPVFLSPSEAEPQLGTLTLTNVTPDSFNLSWTTRDGPFATFVIKIRDSLAAQEAQELTVPGGTRSAHISGLTDHTAYDIHIQGTTRAGVHTEPLTAFVTTGTCLKLWSPFLGSGKCASQKSSPQHGISCQQQWVCLETWCKEGSEQEC